MRFRTLAALTLVMALLASSLSALACGFECFPTSEVGTGVEAAGPEPSQGSCHRKAEQAEADGFALEAVPHDCSTHAPLIPRLRQPGAAAFSAKATSAVPQFPGERTGASTFILLGAGSSTRDLAPPGRTPGLIAPLRI